MIFMLKFFKLLYFLSLRLHHFSIFNSHSMYKRSNRITDLLLNEHMVTFAEGKIKMIDQAA